MIEKIKYQFFKIILLPFWLLITVDKYFDFIKLDILEWTNRRCYNKEVSIYYQFVKLMVFEIAFRNVLYFRLGGKSLLISFLIKPLDSLYLAMPRDKVGPGFYISHGFSTMIGPKSIGRNCWINQQVTIGYVGFDDSPTIGDNVYIFAGAILVGNIFIGDNSIIGAGTVVTKSVPANCTVVGNPAKIVKRDGVKVNEKL